jgi:hypothetical protein
MNDGPREEIAFGGLGVLVVCSHVFSSALFVSVCFEFYCHILGSAAVGMQNLVV